MVIVTVDWSCICLACSESFIGRCTTGITNVIVCPKCGAVNNVYVPECSDEKSTNNLYMENDPRFVTEPSSIGARPV